MRLPYTVAREIVGITVAWEIINIPRRLGWFQIKPEAIDMLRSIDFVADWTLLLAIAYSCAAILHNARIEYEKDLAARKK